MCGIAVILEGSAVEVSPFAIERMTAALRHRGPDEKACVTRPGSQLGHTRLSIIDPAAGHQPMSDPSGRYWIVFNGEIYNFREVRAKLGDYQFKTNGDTEVILAAYLAWG